MMMRRLINTVRYLGGFYRLFIGSMAGIGALRVAPVRAVLFRQVYFTGIEAMGKLAVIGALIGIVIITQVKNLVGLNAVLTGKILLWTVVRELGPLLASIIIIARSSTATASELGSMKVQREVESLVLMGIDPLRYLIVPRVVGITLSVFILTFYFQGIAIAGGLAVSSVLMDIPFFEHLRGIFSALGFLDMAVSLLKSAAFGLVISVVSCYHCLSVRASITEIPQATTVAVMQSLFLVFILDGIITTVLFI